MSYLLQVRALEREALAMQGLRPHLDAKTKLPMVDEALAEFEAWLNEVPKESDRTVVDPELAELYDLLGVGQRRR